MITVTPKAHRLLDDYFKDKEKQTIRLFVRLGICGIRTFGIALEPPEASDRIFHIDGYTFVINKKLFGLVRPITVDSDGVGFRISGNGVAPPMGCGSCGNMCGVRGGRRCTGDCAACEWQCGQGRRMKKHATG